MAVSVSLAVCSPRTDFYGRPRDCIAAGRVLFCEVFMSDFLLSCFDLLFDLLPKVDNLLITLPFFAILLSVVFALTFKLIRGDYW